MPGEKFSTALMPAATTRFEDVLRGRRRHGDDGDADAVAPRDLLQIVDVVDRHAAARLLADLLAQVVEERRDLEAFLAEARIVGEREAEVAGAHDRDAQLAIEAEDLAQVALQIADVVADAADAELAEVREVLANLRGVQVELLGERLRRDGADAGVLERVQAAQVDGKPIGGELGDLIARSVSPALVLPATAALFDCFHKPDADCSKKPHANIPPMATTAATARCRDRPSRFSRTCRPTQSPAEFTLKAIVIGVLFGLLFGASTVYLGLRAGLTVSASIPIAVLAISVLKKLGGSTILENNIVQTIGSAGESVAGGVVFTIPALIFLTPDGPAYFNYYQIAMLAFAGGILGVLMMVPLRRALIVKEHGVLPYPEGAACADVLVAGERGGKLASMVFSGRRRSARCGRRCRGSSTSSSRSSTTRRRARSQFPERDAERRHLARVHGRRLRHRSAHRGHDVRRRRAVVARAAAAAVDPRRLHPGAVSADSSELRQQPGDRRGRSRSRR